MLWIAGCSVSSSDADISSDTSQSADLRSRVTAHEELIAVSSSDADSSSDASEPVDLRSKVMAHEELIADCMHVAGFEYIAALPGDVLMEEARSEAEARGEDPVKAIESLDLPDNPNDRIIQGLNPEEMAAYQLAFWGPTGVDGCYYSTYESGWGVDIIEMSGELSDNLAEVEARIDSDPRVVAAREEFTSCVGRAGYEVSSIRDINEYYARAEYEVVRQIEATGVTDITPDNPQWMEFQSLMDEFRVVVDECGEDYYSIVQPIENEYLGHG